MQPVVTDGVACSVGLSVTIVSPVKTAETIEMPFGLWTQVGPINHISDRVDIGQCEGAILTAKGAAHCKV